MSFNLILMVLTVLMAVLLMSLIADAMKPQRKQKGRAQRARNCVGGIQAALCGSRLTYLENIAEGVHADGKITKKADAAITERYLLGKAGSDIAHVAVCGVGDDPIGVITDEAAAAEDVVNVSLLGAGKGTIRMVASAAIAAGALLEPAANGRVATLGGGAGTHRVVGRALDAAAAAGDVIEVDPFYFLRVI